MPQKDDLTPPQTGKGDVVHVLAKAGLSSLPIVGSAASEIFSFVIAPPIEKRRTKWMEQIAAVIRELQDQQELSFEELQSNDAFIDTVFQASQIAIRTSQEIKLQALRNAVKNSALSTSPNESRQQIFLNYVDIFTVWHLKILRLFQDPQKWAKENDHQFENFYMAGLSSILEDAYPELKGQRGFYDQVWKDLNQYGLVNTDSLHATMTGNGLMASRTTALGNKFLEFIAT